jgi:hypothetical protein
MESTTLKAHITWGPADMLGWYTGGQIPEGSCRIQIKYSTVNEQLVKDTSYVIVDGKDMVVKKTHLRGVPNLNRILLDLIEKDD